MIAASEAADRQLHQKPVTLKRGEHYVKSGTERRKPQGQVRPLPTGATLLSALNVHLVESVRCPGKQSE